MSSLFLNVWMLVAIAAASVPAIIEWLFRRRKRQVELPTLRFLLNNKEQEKVRRQDRILLILRTVAILLLVLALARPMIQRGWLKTGGHRNVIVLLDGTASTQQSLAVGTSFDQARMKAAGVLRGLPEGSTVAAVLLGEQAEVKVAPTRDLYTAAATVDGLRASSGSGSIDKGLEKVRELAGSMDRPEVYVFSDFQKQTWQPPAMESRARVGQLLGELGGRGEVFLVDVGNDATRSWFNYLVTGLRPSSPVVSASMPVNFTVTVEARGRVPEDKVAKVTFYVDKVKKAVQETHVGDRPVKLTFEHRFPKAGEFLVEAMVEGDEYLLDNKRMYLCSVPEAVGVLILDDQAGQPEGEDGDGALLARAISPGVMGPKGSAPGAGLKVAGLDTVSHFAAKVISPAQLSFENLDDYALVVLTATHGLTGAMATRLEDYVRQGGSAWIFAGPAVSPYDYNRFLFKKGRGLLPCKLLTVAAASQPDGLLPMFNLSHHPALAELVDRGPQSIPDAGVLQYYTVENPPDGQGGGAGGMARVLDLSNGQPLLIEKTFGQGRVLLCTTTAGCDAGRWSYLPAVAEYGVMIQELLKYFVGEPDRAVNLEVGGTFRQPLMVSAEQPQLRCPDGKRVSLPPRKTPREAALDFAVRDGAVLVSSPEDLLTPSTQPAESPVNQKLARKLNEKLQFSPADRRLTQVTLDSAIAALARQQDVVIHVNWPALEEAGVSRTATFSIAIDPDATLGQALRGLLGEVAGYNYSVEFSRTDQLGLYEVAKSVQGSQLSRQRFVVNPTDLESDLSRLDERDAKELSPAANWTWVGPEQSVEDLASRLHTVIEMAPMLLIVLASVLAAESLLAWRFGRRRGGVVENVK